MELQFQKNIISCMRPIAREVQNQELTQEVRLTDGMPDIGKILACWGQVLIRSKEWHSGNVGVSGGVMAWVLYEPEEGGAVQSMATWLPFQMKWDIPETQRDGTMQVHGLLRGMDARSISARKIMLRAGVGIMAEAMVPGDVEIYYATECPEDVQLLKNTYPINIPVEAGEKAFVIDEAISLPESSPAIQRLVRYELIPEVQEQKVISDKVVFRGIGKLHILYLSADGKLCSLDMQLPFSQYAQLDKEHSPESSAKICLAMTNLELEQGEEENLNLKAGLIGQYVIFDEQIIEMTEDAYCNFRDVKLHFSEASIPVCLECRTETVTARQSAQLGNVSCVDLSFAPDHPQLYREGDTVTGEMSGVFQMLYYDENDLLSSDTFRWEEEWTTVASQKSKMFAMLQLAGNPKISYSADNLLLECDMERQVTAVAKEPLSMIAQLELGDVKEPDLDRPSLILRKPGNASLWELAKYAGSTVEAIQKANKLQQEPSEDQMLIIPIC